ncbi:DUF3592 domain-containing protein [Flavobacterium phragmitis]|uniref:DUF3592 domain-containing protein n=1 Tax=Flavobacterium phragmitis TaxID=739143 RepID=A0A1I1TU30_9FLAO|nr:DUF3592 domain-containing protein [Flavobacterium phragmitis]SFD62186.1 Protein of unknown function [Flavobacterium phragmitis]
MEFNKKYGIPIVIFFVFFMFYKPVICCLMMGMLALIYAVNSIFFLNNISKNGIGITGKIVSYESDNEGYKTPVIEFKTAEETLITGKPSFHTSSDLDKFRSYRGNIDKPIKIVYDPKNPEKFILKDNSNGCGLIFLIIIGLIFTYISIGNLMGYNNIF